VSIVRIFFNPLDAASKVEYPIAPGTQLIDFLQREYPCGFDGVLRVFVGVEELAIENLDYEVGEHEQITMLVMPGITMAALGTYLIQALIAFAIGYVINLIFAPDVPGAPNGADESSVYSLSPTRNSARLGEPIEVIYGTVSYPPSFASVPYAFYSGDSNDQFIDELLCLGNGYFENISITIGDTPVTILSPGTVQYWVYSPDDHNSTAGVIEADILAKVAGTAVPFPFWENCFTSPEVDNYEFSQAITDTQIQAPFEGSAYAQTTNGAGGVILGRFENVNSALDLQVGDIITLSGTTLNNSTFTIGSIIRNGATMTIFQKVGDANQIVTEAPLDPTPVYLLNVTTNGQFAGPFRCQKLGQPINRVICDFVFPRGLYYVDGSDGDIKETAVTLGISVQRIDEITDLPIGLPVEVEKTTSGRTTSPVRTSIDSGLLTAGAYEVTAQYIAGWGGQKTTADASLIAVRGIVVLDTTVGATYGPVSLLAIRMKATQGLAGAARSRIRVRATRVLDPSIPTLLGNNPMTAIKDVWTNTEYGLGRSVSELDPHVTSLEATWALGSGPYINGAFDQRGTGYEAMGRIASAVAGRVVNNGGLTDVVIERAQGARIALFNAATIIKDSLSLTYNFDTSGDYDGIEVSYSDPDTFEARYETFPFSPVPEYPDTYTLWGVTDTTYAQQMAQYLNNVKGNRRKLVRFETELDGWLVAFGDRIGVSFPMPLWGESGVIVELINATTVRVDKNLDWQPGRLVMLRNDRGQPNGPYTVTMGATPNIIVFSSAPVDIVLHDMDGREPTSYVYGDEDSMIMDFVVSRVTPKGGTRFEIEAQTYSELIYVGAPAHMGGTTCNIYSCSAYKDAAANFFQEYWPIDDLQGSSIVNNLNTANDLGTFGVVNNQQPMVTPINECSPPVGGRVQGTVYRGSNQGGVPPFSGYGAYSFTVGCIVKRIAGTQNLINMGIATSSNYVTIGITGPSSLSLQVRGGTIHTWSTGFDFTNGALLVVAFKMDSGTGPYEAHLYGVNGYVTTITGSVADSAVFPNKFLIGTGSGSGTENIIIKDLGYDPTYKTDTEIEALIQAWAQNKTSYVDPDPFCTPP